MLLAVFMLEMLTLSKTLKSSRDDFNVKYKNGNLYLTLKSSPDDFNVLDDSNVLDNFNVSSINASIENKFAKQMVSLSGIVATWKETTRTHPNQSLDTLIFLIILNSI